MSVVFLQVLARNPRAATTIVQEGALPALAAAAGEGLSDRAQLNAAKVTMQPLLVLSSRMQHVVCVCSSEGS